MKYWKKVVVIVGVVVAVIASHYIGWLSPIEESIYRLVSPLSQQFYNRKVTGNIGYNSLDELLVAFSNLQRDNQSLQAQAAMHDVLLEENKSLRAMLAFYSSSTFSVLGASVVGTDVDPLSSTLIINQGSTQGIQPGQPVIAQEGVLVGQVIRTDRQRAIVRLLNDTRSKVAASALNADKSSGIIEGGFGLSVRLTFIPQNELVQIGDTIVTSGLSETVPRGLLIGTVEAIEKEVYQPFQTAVVRPTIPLDKLQVVAVVLN